MKLKRIIAGTLLMVMVMVGQTWASERTGGMMLYMSFGKPQPIRRIDGMLSTSRLVLGLSAEVPTSSNSSMSLETVIGVAMGDKENNNIVTNHLLLAGLRLAYHPVPWLIFCGAWHSGMVSNYATFPTTSGHQLSAGFDWGFLRHLGISPYVIDGESGQGDPYVRRLLPWPRRLVDR